MKTSNTLAVSITAIAALLCAAPSLAAAADTPPIDVAVDAHAGLSIVPATGLGVNDAVWDSELGSSATSSLLGRAGVQTIRYPGGSYGDIYHWQDNTAPGGYVAPNTDFDTFMASVAKVGAQPIIIANYGTGTAAEAAGWVQYANKTKQYNVKYWEIGNEIYGNGHYGSSWEADNHADKSPAAYAAAVVDYASAMKAIDPSIKIGAVLTTPGNWPDGLVGSGDAGTWNQVVLSIAGPSIDFVAVHWYPGGSNAVDALNKPAQATDIGDMIRAQIARYAGANSSRIGVALTEINTNQGMDTQPGALFAADAYPELWASGMFTVNWWDVHNGPTAASTVAGQNDYGDYGLLSSASCVANSTVCEPALNTPFAPYYALQMLGDFANSGDQLIRVTTGNPLVHAHAVRHRNGGLSVLLLNEDPANAQQVSLHYQGIIPAPIAMVRTYVNGGTEIAHGHTGAALRQTLPAYSLTLLEVPSLLPTLPVPAPGAPTVSALTDSSATVTWPPAEERLPFVTYEVYLQEADGSELAGVTRDNTLNLTGLQPGTRYTVTVVARGLLGLESWSSCAVSFVTGTPARSNCAVHLTNAADWGSGYVGTLDITNSGTDPVNGWTLAFSFPRPWESFGGGWNATWTADGVDVLATNVDWNAAIAPGATVNIGFVGNYAGPNVLPNLFTLNGTICTTN